MQMKAGICKCQPVTPGLSVNISLEVRVYLRFLIIMLMILMAKKINSFLSSKHETEAKSTRRDSRC